MIPLIEVKEKAVAEGVPETTIIRDYALGWLLKAINDLSGSFALKCGTGIRKAYIEDYRFSVDIDFTLTENLEIKKLLQEAVKHSRRESGIEFEDEVNMKTVKTGFEAKIRFRLFYRFPMMLKVDITTIDNELIVRPLKRRRLIHPFSDESEAMVLAYSLEEIMAEKIRSLFERTRPRDLFDVWYLSDILDTNKVLPLVERKFTPRKVEFNIERFTQRKEAFSSAWKPSFKNQLKEQPNFESVFSKVESLLQTMAAKNRKKNWQVL